MQSNAIELKEEQIDQAAEIIAESFLNLNEIWRSRGAER
jgi:hypothetical protein